MSSLTDFLFSGVLVRFPTLKLAYSEGQIGWIPYILERADDVWREHRAWGGVRDIVPEPPSTYYYRQVFGCFFRDRHGIESLDRVGVDNTTFETDYPHTDSTWPDTKKLAEEYMQGLPDDVVYKIMRGNAIRMLEPRPRPVVTVVAIEGEPHGSSSRDPRTSATWVATRTTTVASVRDRSRLPERLALVHDRRSTCGTASTTLGIRTVIDLRAGHEVDEFSHGPLEATGVRFLHRPVVDETRRDRIIRDPGAPAPELLSPAAIYLMMLERFADRLTDVVRLIADPANHPVVFHCAAGKDRTGIVAALVLGVLGVDDETIVDDYVLTAEHMPLIVQRHRAVAAERGVEAEVGDPHFAAEAEAMRDVLTGLDDRHAIDGRGVSRATSSPTASNPKPCDPPQHPPHLTGPVAGRDEFAGRPVRVGRPRRLRGWSAAVCGGTIAVRSSSCRQPDRAGDPAALCAGVRTARAQRRRGRRSTSARCRVADAVTIDAVARLALAARRLGCEVQLPRRAARAARTSSRSPACDDVVSELGAATRSNRSGRPKSGKRRSTSRKKLNSTIRPSEISSTCNAQGSCSPFGPLGLYWPNAGEPFAATVGITREPRHAAPVVSQNEKICSRPWSHIANGGIDWVASSAISAVSDSMS